MNKTKLLILAIATCLLFSCGKKKADDPMGENGRTKRTENLLAHLDSITQKGYLFGHQDATLYGEGWALDSARSDVQTCCGDMPAVIGFEIGGIETDDSVNIYGIPFDNIRKEIINQYDRGGVVTISWQCRKPLSGIEDIIDGAKHHDAFMEWIDKVAAFINSLETPYGVRVPVILRPWQINGENKFWWADCNTEQYKALWQMTHERMEKNDVVNVLYAYSLSATASADSSLYMARYPGDEMVDVMGINYYCHAEEGDTTALANYTNILAANLKMLTLTGKKHGKPIALTETGYRSIQSDRWWTETLAPALKDIPVSYVMLWRNAYEVPRHYYCPFPGQRSIEDFVSFYNDPKTLFLHDVNALYLDTKKKEE